jgi:hypothetical protein
VSLLERGLGARAGVALFLQIEFETVSRDKRRDESLLDVLAILALRVNGELRLLELYLSLRDSLALLLQLRLEPLAEFLLIAQSGRLSC